MKLLFFLLFIAAVVAFFANIMVLPIIVGLGVLAIHLYRKKNDYFVNGRDGELYSPLNGKVKEIRTLGSKNQYVIHIKVLNPIYQRVVCFAPGSIERLSSTGRTAAIDVNKSGDKFSLRIFSGLPWKCHRFCILPEDRVYYRSILGYIFWGRSALLYVPMNHHLVVSEGSMVYGGLSLIAKRIDKNE